jgi:MFS transporter, PAT family, beta-lactamase induction signal transducer AmpG
VRLLPSSAVVVERRQGFLDAMTSWRTASVSLLSFSSGLPLGVVLLAIPDWLRSVGVDIKLVGLFGLTQAPWSFKMLWSPLMDRYVPPFLGRRRGWAAIAQVALLLLTLGLAGVGQHPDAPWVVAALALAIAVASATQDIAIDAYAVEVLRPDEQGVAVGARTAIYRAAMFVAGGLSISLAGRWGWPAVNVMLALLYLPMLVVTWWAPEPEERPVAPTTLRDAIWLPFLGFLARHRALEILAFVVFYKLADNLAGALLRPFLIDMGYSADDRGVALGTVGLVATLTGTFLGGAVTTAIGLGHALWAFGILQIGSNAGYILLADHPVDRPLMYAAIGFEQLTSGMGTGAFAVLLLRLTQRRFSATQFALFSSLFGLPRILAGPVSGFLVDAIGWKAFFWFTIACGFPGLLLLARFVPLGTREPEFTIEPPSSREPLGTGALVGRGVAGTAIGAAIAASLMAMLPWLKGDARFEDALAAIMRPEDLAAWAQLAGVVAFGAIAGLFTAATAAARHGAVSTDQLA